MEIGPHTLAEEIWLAGDDDGCRSWFFLKHAHLQFCSMVYILGLTFR